MAGKRLLLGAVGVAAVVAGWNYFGVHRPVSQRLAQDSRNESVRIWAHHRYGLQPAAIVLDLRDVNDKAAPLDVLRALFQAAEALKGSRFDKVFLAYAGTSKFYVEGEYFQALGREFEDQNPVYLIRTLPENIYKLDGAKAYGTWTGGLLGVLGKQMEDVNQLSMDWYLTDMAATQRSK